MKLATASAQGSAADDFAIGIRTELRRDLTRWNGALGQWIAFMNTLRQIEVNRTKASVVAMNSEITAASHEQSSGVSQMGQAIAQMDRVTQQNAALVEQMAAAASSLKTQAQDLVGTVAVFKLSPGAAQRVGEHQPQFTPALPSISTAPSTSSIVQTQQTMALPFSG